MTPANKRAFNTGIGSLFLGLGVIAWGIALYFAMVPSDKRRLPAISLAPSVEVSSCRNIATSLYGFQARVVGDELVLTTNDIQDPLSSLEKATATLALCKRELKEFCMGVGCGEAALTMTLVRPANQRAYVQTEAKPSAKPAGAARPTPPAKS